MKKKPREGEDVYLKKLEFLSFLHYKNKIKN